MNYGNFGFILNENEAWRIGFSREVFSAFSLSNGSKLYGIYYPCPHEVNDDSYDHETIEHDFMITPIPQTLWQASGSITLFLKNKPGALKNVSEYLKTNRVSIIRAECTRSTHRYATWSAHIVFEELLGHELDYNTAHKSYKATVDALKELKKDLAVVCADYLFSTDHKERAINVSSNHSLAFFNNFHLDNIKHNKNELSKPFELTVGDIDSSKLQKLEGDGIFKDILLKLNLVDKGLFPAITFSELNTRELCLRTVPISENDANRFFKVSIKYSRKGKSDTGVGVVHALTDNIPGHYNIWHHYNRIKDNNPLSESGEVVFLIEDILRFQARETKQTFHANVRKFRDYRGATSYQKEAFDHFTDVIDDNNNSLTQKPEFRFDELRIFSLPKSRVIQEILIEDSKARLTRDFKFDVFISYSRKDEVIVDDFCEMLKKDKKISYYLDKKDVQFGENISNSILKNIRDSREICLFVSKNSMKSNWVVAERGAAWILDKTITCIVIDEKTRIPDILHMDFRVNWAEENQVLKYIKEINERIIESEAVKFSKTFPLK